MYGGKLPPNQYAGPWKWCTCSAASELRDREPEAVDNANRARQTLIHLEAASGRQERQGRIGVQPASLVTEPTCRPLEASEEDYKGEF